MPLYTDITSNTVHDYDPATFGESLLANLVRCGVLIEGDHTGDADSPAEPVELEDLKVSDLRSLADELGVETSPKATKADLIAAIEAVRADGEGDDSGDSDSPTED